MSTDGDSRSWEGLWPLSAILSQDWNPNLLVPCWRYSAPFWPNLLNFYLLSIPKEKRKSSIGPWIKLFCVLGVDRGETVGAQLLHNYTNIPPTLSSRLTPTSSRIEARSSPRSTLSKASDPRSHFVATIPHFCKLSTAAQSWRGRRQPIFQHWTSWPLESLLKHHQCVMPTSFLGENKSYFSLFFFSLMERTKTPFWIQLSLLWHKKKKFRKQICQNSHPAFLVTFFNSVGSMWGSLLLIGIPGGLATQAEEYLGEGWRGLTPEQWTGIKPGLIRKTWLPY